MKTAPTNRIFNVKPYSGEDDNYVELWQDMDNQKQFFARYTLCGGMWYTVSDPLGYCELNSACPESYIFRVHGWDGNFLFISSNAEDAEHPITFDEAVKQTVRSIDTSEINPDSTELNDFILSHLTPELEEKLHSQGLNCIRANFRDFWHQAESGEIIHIFKHLGHPYYLWKVRYKHKFADFEWFEYLVGDADYIDNPYPNCYKWLGWSKIVKGENENGKN